MKADHLLADAILSGDEEALRHFFELYADRLYRVALRRLGFESDLALGVVHDTLCHAIENLRSFRRQSTLYTWLYASCLQRVRDHYRKHRTIERREISGDSPDLRAGAPMNAEESLDTRRRSLRLHEALDLLADHQAEILRMKYFEHRSVQQIGDALGVSRKAAESRLGRAKLALRQQLAQLAPSLPASSLGSKRHSR